MIVDITHVLRKLQTYTNVSYLIISIYLTLNQDMPSDALVKQFTSFIQRELSFKRRQALEQDLIYIQSFLTEFANTKGYQGLAIFSGNNSVWEVIPTAFSLSNLVRIQHSPYLDPLVKQLANEEYFLVLLTDREKALYFILHNGVIEKKGKIKDASVPHHGIGRNESMLETNMQNHEQQHLNKHLALIGTKVSQFTKNIPIAGVIVGGHKTLIHKTQKYLPKRLQGKVIGEFVSELQVDTNQIIEKCDKILSGFTLPISIEPHAILANP